MNEKSKLSLKNYFDNITDYNNERLNTACSKKDCVLYPKCFGFACKMICREKYCTNYIKNIKSYLKEYFH